MLALISVWLGLVAVLLSAAMAVRRLWFTDAWLTVALYTAILALTLAGMALWALRKEPAAGPGVAGRRRQSKVGIGLSLTAITIVYILVAMDRAAAP
jgi:vacuolar-type H+-ATPase subunit I/STV1